MATMKPLVTVAAGMASAAVCWAASPTSSEAQTPADGRADEPASFCEALNAALDAAAANAVGDLAAPATIGLAERRAPDAAPAPPLAPPPFTACARAVAGFPSCAVEASPFGAGWTLALQPTPVGPDAAGDGASAPPGDAQAWAAMVAACAPSDLKAFEPPWPAGPRVRARVGFTGRDDAARVVITELQTAEATTLTLLVEAHSRDAGRLVEPALRDRDPLAGDHSPLRKP